MYGQSIGRNLKNNIVKWLSNQKNNILLFYCILVFLVYVVIGMRGSQRVLCTTIGTPTDGKFVPVTKLSTFIWIFGMHTFCNIIFLFNLHNV